MYRTWLGQEFQRKSNHWSTVERAMCSFQRSALGAASAEPQYFGTPLRVDDDGFGLETMADHNLDRHSSGDCRN